MLSDHVAVMNRGRFEQVGTPQELYYRPATPFVAGFVGANNRIAGRATAVDGGDRRGGDRRRLDDPRARRSGPVAAGDAVEAFVRPEVARLGAQRRGTAGGAAGARRRGREPAVRRRELRGAAAARRRAASSSASRCRRPASSRTCKPASTIQFSFDPERAVVLRRRADAPWLSARPAALAGAAAARAAARAGAAVAARADRAAARRPRACCRCASASGRASMRRAWRSTGPSSASRCTGTCSCAPP